MYLTYTSIPQCNPVERTNHIIKTMLAQFEDRNHKNWDEYLLENLRLTPRATRSQGTRHVLKFRMGISISCKRPESAKRIRAAARYHAPVS